RGGAGRHVASRESGDLRVDRCRLARVPLSRRAELAAACLRRTCRGGGRDGALGTDPACAAPRAAARARDARRVVEAPAVVARRGGGWRRPGVCAAADPPPRRPLTPPFLCWCTSS